MRIACDRREPVAGQQADVQGSGSATTATFRVDEHKSPVQFLFESMDGRPWRVDFQLLRRVVDV